jgi:putative ABC transport system permease protein
MGGQVDKSVYVPYTPVQRLVRGEEPLEAMVFEPRTAAESGIAGGQIRALLGLHHDFDPSVETALSFVDIQEVLGIVKRIGFGLRIFLVAAGLVTIFVGAVGIMNIMLVVVGERRREIGLRKALGARGRDVFVQFLAETVAVCLLSGALGAALGALAIRAMAAAVRGGSGFTSPPELSAATLFGVAFVLVATGVAAGVIPALRAARVDPSESLRAS